MPATLITDETGSTECISISIKDDAVYELDQTFTISISSNGIDRNVEITRDSAQVTIIDNDGKSWQTGRNNVNDEDQYNTM